MTAYYNEIDPYAARWLRNLIDAGHIAPGDVDTRSIEDVTPADLAGYTQCHFFAGIGVWSYALRMAGWPDDRRVWTGSCPCQPFSQAGKGGGAADERHLWPAWYHLIELCKPPNVFGEQVASPAGLGWLDLVQADLERSGYAVGAADLCAAGVGAPHIRQRLYFAGTLEHATSEQMGVSGRTRESRGSVGELANHGLEGRRQVGPDAGRSDERSGAERLDERPLHSGAIKLGLPDSAGPQSGRKTTPPAGHGGSVVAASCMGDDDDKGLEGRGLPAGGRADQRTAWSPSDFVWCRDGKWRPVEPGSFPLVNGAPARVGRLRAYGNAIVAPLAKEFIAAYLECRP